MAGPGKLAPPHLGARLFAFSLGHDLGVIAATLTAKSVGSPCCGQQLRPLSQPEGRCSGQQFVAPLRSVEVRASQKHAWCEEKQLPRT